MIGRLRGLMGLRARSTAAGRVVRPDTGPAADADWRADAVWRLDATGAADVAWQVEVTGAPPVWMRADDVLVVGDDLIDIRTGLRVAEPPWEFLGLRSWSLQRWEPRLLPVGAQGPHGGDDCETRLREGLLVVGKTTRTGKDLVTAVEARDAASREAAWQYRAPGPEGVAMWGDWLRAVDGTVFRRPQGNRYGHRELRYPDLATGECRWTLPWDARQWPATDSRGGDARGEVVTVFDTWQAGVGGVDAATGAMLWRVNLEAATPAFARAAGDYVVVGSFPEDVNRRPYMSHVPPPPVARTGRCTCEQGVVARAGDNTCTRCGGFFTPPMTITVHDRRTGAALWNRTWPWREELTTPSAGEATTIADSASGPVLVTQEGDSLHAWRLGDGTALWSLAASEVTHVPPHMHGSKFSFRADERQPLNGWVWLRDVHGSVAEGTRGSRDLFIHPVTGEQAALTDVFYLSAGGLAVSKTGGTITCHVLGEINRIAARAAPGTGDGSVDRHGEAGRDVHLDPPPV